MELYLWLAVIILLCTAVGFGIKIFLMKKAAEEICEKFRRHLESDTNVLIDISSADGDMKRLAESINTELRKLRRQRHRYVQGDMELKEAVTNISHDLRTPLTAIKGYLELLEEEEKGETVDKYLKQISNRTEAMNKLTEELFSYSVTSSHEEEAYEELDLCRVFQESLLSFWGAMEQRGITPQVAMPDAPVIRLMNRMDVNRIFNNIISNSLKYSDGDFSARLSPDGTVVFFNSAENLDIVDTARLFDRFYTLQTGRSSTGLGLSIAKLLTERMGGTIGAEYREGKLFIILNFPE